MASKLFLSIMLLFVLASSAPISLVGASSEMWSKTYGNGKETGHSLIETSDGGFAIAGDTRSFGAGGNDFWLVKMDANGNMEWNQTYGGPESERAKALIKTSDGGFAIAGHYTHPSGECDFWLVKTDSYGNMEWNQTYGGPGVDLANSLIETSDGGYAIGGSFNPDYEDPFGDRDFWLVKTDSYGNMEWNRTYRDSPSNYCSDLVETNDGGYLLAGNTGRYLVEANIWIIKTDEQGNIEWDKRYGGREHSGANSVVKTSDGGYALAGYLSQDFWLIKIDGSGNIKWNQTYSKSGVEEAYSLVVTSDGGYALAGITTGAIGKQSYIDSWMVKTDTSGNEIWSQTYGGTGDQYLYSLIETSNGAFALAGFKTSTYAGPPDLWLIKTDEYGNIPEFPLWTPTLLVLVVFAVTVVIYKRRLPKQATQQSY